jgi:CRISPR system Cascade subunit CasE
MFISKLTLAVDTPSRDLLRDLANPYDLHRTLTRAVATQPDQPPPRLLFRLEAAPEASRPAGLLVQTPDEPTWDTLPDGYLVTGPPKQFTPAVAAGQHLRFRLRANPVKRDNATGKRVSLIGEEAQRDWLVRKGNRHGFDVVAARMSAQTRQVARKNGRRLTHDTVTYDGLLAVTDPDALADAVASGIGPGKAFGCGLLSLAPA